ncbi:uncharacterized protein EAF02_005363 [Botrytis sinoallii]|uniref:uncharacterized protein n=1 Tax=Botrytis sinoallii TaxID=1463999 RepID=UPI00190019DB|nr:uncharacterized protein EAF02_005363 [Botrytis sinoallii]KAF7883443.1 hypothetical protein EAF02_005363 [Botrytis sinoallii]
MRRGKKMAGNANLEPLGSRTKIPTYNSSPLKQEKNDEDPPHFRAEGSSYIFGSIKQEGNNEYRFRSRSPLETRRPPRRIRSRSRSRSLTTTIVPFLEPVGIPSPSIAFQKPKSSYISQSPHKSRQSRRSISSISAQKVSSSSSYRSRSPRHRDQDTTKGSYYGKSPRRGSPTDEGASRGFYYRPSPYGDTPMDRGVQNSSYYRPITLTTVSCTKPSSRKRGEFMVPAYNYPEPSSPIEESWAEIASRKHKESMANRAANMTTSKHISLATSVGESKPLKKAVTLEKWESVAKGTPVSPVRGERSLLFKRKKQSKAEGLDIQNQISSLLYPRKRKDLQIPPTESKMNVTTDVEKGVGVAKLFESSAQNSSPPPLPIPLQEMHSQSEALLSASDQGIHPERQGFAESRLTISSPKIKIDTQTLQSKIQELRPSSSFDEKPRPIPSIMNELSFTDDPFESDHM